MKRTAIFDLPLHYGKCPPWLFAYMKRLLKPIVIVILMEYGPAELLKRFADPYFFQSLGCVLGFDWHSSGLTTTLCGALKEVINEMSEDCGIFVAGGKGSTSRKTPLEINSFLDKTGWNIDGRRLIYASRLTAKVDNVAIQDGYTLYHHVFLFDKLGNWVVIQQGMSEMNRYARRYHWISENLDSFISDPHSDVCGLKQQKVLNMVASESKPFRELVVEFLHEKPANLLKDLKRVEYMEFPLQHTVVVTSGIKQLERNINRLYESNIKDFEQLLGQEGIGRASLRALALVSELIYNTSPSRRDPVTFSFAHGGKDGTPYPVNRKRYEETIQTLEQILTSAKLEYTDKIKVFKKLKDLV